MTRQRSRRPESAEPTPTGTARRSLLLEAPFAPYFFANTTSNTGMWFHNIASAVVVYDLTRSALLVGVVTTLQFAATLLLSPYAGSLTDRLDRRRLLLTGQCVAAVPAMVLAGISLVAEDMAAVGVAPVFIASAIIGIGTALAVPAMQALLPALVAPADLDRAVALNTVSFTVARALGPALAGVALALFGPAVAFAINAASYVPLLVVLLLMRPRPAADVNTTSGKVLEGMRYVRENSWLLVLLASIATLGFGSDPVNTLIPAIADRLGGGDHLVGWMVGSFGAGAVLAGTFAARVGRRIGFRRMGGTGLATLGLGMAVLAIAPSTAVAVTALGVAGVGFLLGNAGLTTVIQHRVSDDYRGRVMALWTIAFLGSRPVAALLNGAIADHVSVPAASGAASLAALGGMLLVVFARDGHGDNSTGE